MTRKIQQPFVDDALNCSYGEIDSSTPLLVSGVQKFTVATRRLKAPYLSPFLLHPPLCLPSPNMDKKPSASEHRVVQLVKGKYNICASR